MSIKLFKNCRASCGERAERSSWSTCATTGAAQMRAARPDGVKTLSRLSRHAPYPPLHRFSLEPSCYIRHRGAVYATALYESHLAETFVVRNRLKYRELTRCKVEPIGLLNKELLSKLAGPVQEVVDASVRALSFARHSILRNKVREGVKRLPPVPCSSDDDQLGAIPVSGETLGYQLTPNCLCHSVGAAMTPDLAWAFLRWLRTVSSPVRHQGFRDS